jgi:two-component system, OmpR family, sensor histidine kinase ChvG
MLSIPFTVPDIATQEVKTPGLWSRWLGRLTLRERILAVNIFALVLLAGSFLYIDSYRLRVIDDRVRQSGNEAQLIATAMRPMSLAEQKSFIGRLGKQTGERLRLANTAGKVVADSWQETGVTIRLVTAADIPWSERPAGWIDQAVDFIVDAGKPRLFKEFEAPALWRPGHAGWSRAEDRTHMIWADAEVDAKVPLRLRTDRNAVDIRQRVRSERSRLGYIIALITGLSVLLSLFLARTIAVPLRELARSAQRVRSGRDREVNVPRLPFRNDEIGLLARALSDMTHTLRQQMDAKEAFAADVAHEIKNPLASLSSATESLKLVTDPQDREQLQNIISQDVRRLDRLISDISDLTRIDVKLSRTHFEPINLVSLTQDILRERNARDQNRDAEIRFDHSAGEQILVRGDADQLVRVVDNLLSNAVSFSPEAGLIRVSVRAQENEILVIVEDNGPGIPAKLRESVFERFHSLRPEGEDFGNHSGLGLAIARTIINGHGGTLSAEEPRGEMSGARLVVRLPAKSV